MSSESERVLVLGASTKSSSYANMATHLLKKHGHTPILVGRSKGQIADVDIQQEIPLIEVDTITLYIRSELQHQYIDDIIKTKPKRVIFNPGTESNDTWRKLTEGNIECIEACTLVMLRTGQF